MKSSIEETYRMLEEAITLISNDRNRLLKENKKLKELLSNMKESK